MAESAPLGAAQIEPVRRIAARVRESSAAGRYFAVGSSAETRDRVERTLAALLNDPRAVVVLDVSTIQGDPWNWVRAEQLRGRRSARGTLYAVHGLGALAHSAASAGRPDPYAQLNLARDAWGATGTHVLLWLDGPDAFDRFLRAAPDLWSHRDLVAWFLTSADFVPPSADSTPLYDQQAREAEAAEALLARAGEPEDSRLAAAAALAIANVERAQPLAAWEVFSSYPRPPSVRRTRRELTDAASRFEEAKAFTLQELGRENDAAGIAQRLLAAATSPPAWWREQVTHRLAQAQLASRPELAIPAMEAALASERPEFLNGLIDNLVLALRNCGEIQRATALNSGRGSEGPERGAWVDERAALLAGATGDFPVALAALSRARRVFGAVGHRRLYLATLSSTGAMLDDWGNHEEADQLLAEHPAGDLASGLWIRTQAWWRRWRRSATAEAVPLVAATSALRGHPVARAVPAAALHDLLELLEDAVEPTDPLLPVLEEVARSLVDAARTGSDKEVEGSARFALARLALLRGQRATAYGLADRTLVDWCRRWRGLVQEADAWCLLASAAPDDAAARAHVTRAKRVADSSPSILAQIRTRRRAAEVEVRAGENAAARRSLGDALALARRQGLRLQELELLHALSEVPGAPDARQAASDALGLALALMLPRDEARALLNLELLARSTGERALPRRLDRASEIVEELGPPKLRARVRAAVASRGE